MFHQSFCVCDEWPNLIDLTEEERMAIVGKDNGFYQIMKIVFIVQLVFLEKNTTKMHK